MKRLYIHPVTDVIRVETTQMIAESIGINSDAEDVDAGYAAGRSYNWDDEEEQ